MSDNKEKEKIYIEFGKIYKRLMEVEIQLCEKIIFGFKNVYKDKAFYRLQSYLKSIINKYNFTRKRNGVSGNYINNIIKSGKTDDVNLNECINRLYLSDLFGILDYPLYYKDKLMIKNLYFEKSWKIKG